MNSTKAAAPSTHAVSPLSTRASLPRGKKGDSLFSRGFGGGNPRAAEGAVDADADGGRRGRARTGRRRGPVHLFVHGASDRFGEPADGQQRLQRGRLDGIHPAQLGDETLATSRSESGDVVEHRLDHAL